MLHSMYQLRSALLLLFLLGAAALSSRLARVGQAADPCSVPSFTGPTNIFLNVPQALVVADFNNDGKNDLAVATDGVSSKISMLLGNGSGASLRCRVFPAGAVQSSSRLVI